MNEKSGGEKHADADAVQVCSTGRIRMGIGGRGDGR